MTDNEFAGSVAVITGGAMGIGEGIAAALVGAGCAVVIVDFDADGPAVAERIGGPDGKARFLRVDVTEETEVAAAVADVRGREGKVDILVNCAGVTRATPIEQIPVEEWDLVMAVNLKGPFLWTKHLAPPMRERRYGRIVNMSSIAAIAGGGFVGTAHYAASKAGVSAFTKAAAKNFGPDGITVNAIAPGPIRTRMSRSWIEKGMEPEIAAGIPVRRIGEIADIVRTALFLAAPSAGFITGQTIFVDGGISIGPSKQTV